MDLGSDRYWNNGFNEFIPIVVLRVINERFNSRVSHTSVSNIVHDRIIEENTVLRHNCNHLSQIIDPHLSDVLSINKDLPFIDIIESIQKSHNCRFARSSLPYYSHWFTSWHFERKVFNNHLSFFLVLYLLVVSEGNISELYFTSFYARFNWVNGISNDLIYF